MNRVQNTSLVLPVFLLCAFGTACNSSSSAAPEGSAPAKDVAPAWAMEYKASCAAAAATPATPAAPTANPPAATPANPAAPAAPAAPTSDDLSSCVGAYGFMVSADGSYQVGPGPQGQIVKGTLDSEDFTALTKAAASSIQGSPSALTAESCNGDFTAATNYTLNISRHGKKHELMHKTGADLCSSELDAESAENLHNEIVELANRYYALPFPDACEDAAQQVSALYAPLGKCSVDADCAYLGSDYAPVTADTSDTIFVDDCSRVKALPVGNIAAVNANLAKLQAALSNAQQTCGVRIARDDCAGSKSFASSAAPAVCQSGACKINPSLGF